MSTCKLTLHTHIQIIRSHHRLAHVLNVMHVKQRASIGKRYLRNFTSTTREFNAKFHPFHEGITLSNHPQNKLNTWTYLHGVGFHQFRRQRDK